jgi:hypothetical protein
MELTKEQNRLKKNCLIKAHYWFGIDVFNKVFKDFDYYIDDENKLFYVYEKDK